MANFYMTLAKDCAKMSRAIRLQVGCIIVKDDNIISFSWNGTPRGWNNNCEDKIYNSRFVKQQDGSWLDPKTYEVVDKEFMDENYPYEDSQGRYYLKTKPEVLHSESNAISKLARSSESGVGADLFVTHSPCLDCAKLIFQSGIKRVYFGTAYRSDEGVEFLKASGIEVTQIEKGQ